MALFSETYLKLHMRFYIQNYDIYWTYREDGHKGGTVIAVKKGIPHTCIDLPALLSVEATGVCITIRNTEMLLAAVYKSPQRLWSDTDITELLGFRNKSILAGDLNAKHPVWISKVSYPSGLKLLESFHCSKLRHFTPTMLYTVHTYGRSDVLDIVVNQNVRLSEVIVTDILDSDHLPIMFSILDHVRMRKALDPVIPRLSSHNCSKSG
jgi:hypothetical protein